MLRDEVLALLKAREGKPLSGEEMSRALGVSRAAVWKAMESLRDEGYVISSAPRRGYALEGSPDRLSAGELAGALAGRRVGRALVCLETVDSTNNEVKRRALAGAADGLAVVAEQQTGGRGRRGRSFVSPPGKGLYLSVLLRPNCPLAEVPTLTAWSAVAVCDAVEAVLADPQADVEAALGLDRKEAESLLAALRADAPLLEMQVLKFFSYPSGLAGCVLDWGGEPVLAFRGTDDLRDALDNFLLLPFNVFSTYYFQAVLRPGSAFGVSVARGLVVSGGLILALPTLFGGQALWWAMPITEGVVALGAAALMARSARGLRAGKY